METLDVEFSHRVSMDDIVAAYRLFLRRPPEPDGYRHWEGQVRKGMSLERLVSVFLEADEFRRLLRPEVTVVEMAGGYSVCLDARETDFAPGILYHHDYEPHVRRAITEVLGEGQTFVDVGANIGCLSLLAARLVGPTGRVYSFEPNPTNLQRLYAGVVLNGYANVRIMPYAVSDQRSIFSLSGGTSNTIVTEARGVDTSSVYTQSTILDEELADLPRLDVIKMDIEGHEPEALRGAVGLIRKHNPTLFLEFAPRCLSEVRGLDPMEILREVFDLYNHARVITLWGDSAEFEDPRAIMDYWHRRDAEVTADGTLPEGMLHFDLIAFNR